MARGRLRAYSLNGERGDDAADRERGWTQQGLGEEDSARRTQQKLQSWQPSPPCSPELEAWGNKQGRKGDDEPRGIREPCHLEGKNLNHLSIHVPWSKKSSDDKSS